MCLLVVMFDVFVSSYVWCVCQQLCLVCLLAVMFGVFVSSYV